MAIESNGLTASSIKDSPLVTIWGVGVSKGLKQPNAPQSPEEVGHDRATEQPSSQAPTSQQITERLEQPTAARPLGRS